MKIGHASYRVECSSARLCSRVGTGIESGFSLEGCQGAKEKRTDPTVTLYILYVLRLLYLTLVSATVSNFMCLYT